MVKLIPFRVRDIRIGNLSTFRQTLTLLPESEKGWIRYLPKIKSYELDTTSSQEEKLESEIYELGFYQRLRPMIRILLRAESYEVGT